MQNTVAAVLFAHPAEKKHTLIVVTLNSPFESDIYFLSLEMALEIKVPSTLLSPEEIFMDLRGKIQKSRLKEST